MNKTNVKRRKNRAISEFRKLLQTGHDYKTNYMYSVVAEKVYSTNRYVQDVMTKYYNEVITDEMVSFFKGLDCSHKEAIIKVASKFNFCKIEAQVIVRYIKFRIKAKNKAQ